MASAETSSEENKPYSVKIDREKAMQELKENGYTVIPNVVPLEECDKYIKQYKDWLSKFGEGTPQTRKSIIQHYRIAHFEPTWNVRLKAKSVYAQIWETEKLLSSFDAVALSPPPSDSPDELRDPDSYWFHLDQGRRRRGLHAYQGAVYLEEASEADYCLRVLKGSHKHFETFFDTFPNAKTRAPTSEFYRLKPKQYEWYLAQGCKPVVVACPKGGMILWDSREVHDSVKPLPGRAVTDRWRHVVFVCMGPARWSTIEDRQKKCDGFRKMETSTHWPCQAVKFFRISNPRHHLNLGVILDKLPDVARSDDVRSLVGIDKYDFHDDKPNGPEWDPVWNN